DKNTLDKAKLINPEGFIVKPFEKADLHTAIELAIFNYNSRKNTGTESIQASDARGEIGVRPQIRLASEIGV
ncbi:MAG TPA: hypothetical protein VF876_15085, partial [Burkholderiales bacterium]